MCDDREKLIAYLYDEASASERRLVDAHLVECGDCREELRGLRSVRQDLLSWDVPEHGSVWKPFVTPSAPVWWKQVPAWGLAAAATLVFGIGLAGGFAARALSAAPLVAQAQPAAAPTPAAQNIAATPEQVRALEARLASLERTSADASNLRAAGLTRVSNIGNSDGDEALLRRVKAMLDESEGRVTQRTSKRILSMISEIDSQRKRDMASVTQQISDAQAQIYGNVSRVANRPAIEKEKEKEQ